MLGYEFVYRGCGCSMTSLRSTSKIISAYRRGILTIYIRDVWHLLEGLAHVPVIAYKRTLRQHKQKYRSNYLIQTKTEWQI